MVRTWRVCLDGETENWPERDVLGAHAELFAQILSHPGRRKELKLLPRCYPN